MSRIAGSRRSVLQHAGPLALALLLSAVAAGCELPLFTATETRSEVFATSDAPTIIVETFNGSIDISNGSNDEVVAEVQKHARGFDEDSARANLENIEISLLQEGNEIRITARRLEHAFGDSGAAVIIAAPRKSKVVLRSSNGYIVSEGLQGGIDARTSNAKVEVFEGSGPIEADSSNGSIRIEATDAVVDARTSNARIRFEGTLADGDHRFKSSNGRIDVMLPKDSEFRFAASTSNGEVDCDFPLESTESRGRRRKAGTVGNNPACVITLATSNSSIRIREQD